MEVRNATCLKPEETTRILDELERDVGFIECNTLNKRSGSRIRFPVLVSELWNGCLDVSIIGRCESA